MKLKPTGSYHPHSHPQKLTLNFGRWNKYTDDVHELEAGKCWERGTDNELGEFTREGLLWPEGIKHKFMEETVFKWSPKYRHLDTPRDGGERCSCKIKYKNRDKKLSKKETSKHVIAQDIDSIFISFSFSYLSNWILKTRKEWSRCIQNLPWDGVGKGALILTQTPREEEPWPEGSCALVWPMELQETER